MKALSLILVVVTSAVSATILVDGVNDKRPTNRLFNSVGEARVQVHADPAIDYGRPRYLNFALTAGKDLGKTGFSIALEMPANEWPGDLYFKLNHGGRELPAEDFIERDPEYKAAVLVSIPNLGHKETVQVSIGWYGAALENYGAVFSVRAETVEIGLVGTWEGPKFDYANSSH